MLLDQLREARKGPGGYEMKQKEKIKGAVEYKKRYHSVESVQDDDEPGPDYYYCKDDLIKERVAAWKFGKEERAKEPSPDKREDLNPNEDFVKPRVPGAQILPEHSGPVDLDKVLEEVRMGPGTYDAQFNLVERRVDIGAVKY